MLRPDEITLATPLDAEVPVGEGQAGAEMLGAIVGALRRRGIFGRPVPRPEGMTLRFRITVEDALEAGIPADRVFRSLLESHSDLRADRDGVRDRLEQLGWQLSARRFTA